MQLNISQNKFVFIFFGNLRRYKGLLDLVEAFRKLEKKDTELLLAGKPEDKNLVALLEKATLGSGNIRLLPRFILDDEIQLLMNASDVMVLPYSDVLTSGAALLGISFGKALIVPKIGCLLDIFNSSNAFLYDPIEKEGLIDAMHRAMNLAKSLNWRDIALHTYQLYDMCVKG